MNLDKTNIRLIHIICTASLYLKIIPFLWLTQDKARFYCTIFLIPMMHKVKVGKYTLDNVFSCYTLLFTHEFERETYPKKNAFQ